MGRAGWMVTAALVRDTFRESSTRLVFWGFYGLSTALIVFFLFILKIDVVEGARASISIFGDRGPARQVEEVVRMFYAGVATFLYTWGMALAVFASAGLVPTILEPGRIELMLSKPVSRHHLLLGRYLGTVLVVAVNVCYLVLGVWTIFGWRTGIWRPAFLYAILTTTFIFAVLLSVILFLSVLFESAAVSVMVTFGLMLFSPIFAQTKMMEKLLSSEWTRALWKGVYYALPKVYDLGKMTVDLVRGKPVDSLMPLWTSAAFAVVLIAAAAALFSRKDY